MIKWLRNKLNSHKQFFSSFGVMICLTIVGNLFQVAAFYFLKKLNEESFAQINFGIYVWVLLSIVNISFGKWLTIELSKLNPAKRFPFFAAVFKKSFFPLAGIVVLIALVLLLSSQDASLVIFLCFISGIVGIVAVFVSSWINAREWFLLLGLSLVVAPVIRLINTIFFVSDDNIWILFVGFIVAALLAIGFLGWYIWSKDRNLLKLEDGEEEGAHVALGNVMLNTVLQTLLSTFWIADGVVLKNVLSDELYNIYVCYAYVFKFPLFICVSVITVVLGKNIFDKGMRNQFLKVFKVAMLLVIGSFGGVLLVELVMEGLILSVLGYSDMVVHGLVYYFGFAWLVQMVVFFLFSFLLKMKGRVGILTWLIVLYSVSYIVSLLVFIQDIFTLLQGILVQGLVFIIILLVRFSKDLFGEGD
ncbi:MAG: hypothetical protein U9Q67_00185 [Patescibacteria group bacterium]|nr:hypothetical protein [Patescibacteria group bacterium]